MMRKVATAGIAMLTLVIPCVTAEMNDPCSGNSNCDSGEYCAPADIGTCWMPGLTSNIVPLEPEPAAGELWLLQVNANFIDGEGPFETSPDCNPRVPIEPCFQDP